MKCEDIKKDLDLYIDSEILSEEDRKEIHAHLDGCEDCRREYEEMKKIKEELAKLSDVELPKDFHRNLIKEIRKTQMKKETFFKRHYKWVTAVAAVLVIGVMATAGLELLPRMGAFRGASVQTADSMNYEMAAAEEAGYGAPEAEFTKSADMYTVTMTFDEEMSDAGMTISPEQPRDSNNGASITDASLERKIVKNVYLEMDTEEIENTFNSIHQYVTSLGGYIEYSNIGDVVYNYYDRTQSTEQMRYATINARVPSDKLESTIGYVETVGEIRTRTLNTQDRSDYYYDVENQVENLKVRETRLRDLMNDAEDISDVIEVERELARVRNEIDSLTRDLSYIDKEVDYSTLNMQIREVLTSTKINPEKRNIFTEAKEGLIKNVNRLLNFLQNAVIWFVSYLPIALVLAAGLGLLYWIIKKLGIKKLRRK